MLLKSIEKPRKKIYLPRKGTQPPLASCTWMDYKCFFIDDSKVEAEHLVLYIAFNSVKNSKGKPKFPVPMEKNWVPLTHQTGGFRCSHTEMFARFLEPTQQAKKLITALNSIYINSNVWKPASLAELVTYNQMLESYGVSAQESYMAFQEAFYPIDIKYIGQLTNEVLPANLNDLFKSNYTNRFGYQYHLAILGENCD